MTAKCHIIIDYNNDGLANLPNDMTFTVIPSKILADVPIMSDAGRSQILVWDYLALSISSDHRHARGRYRYLYLDSFDEVLHELSCGSQRRS